MFESKKKPLLSKRKFISRALINLFMGLLILLVSLGVGLVGYRYLGEMSWVDAYLNASMILSGMGPVTELTNSTAKIFSGTYALFSGIIFLVAIAITLAPLYHRFLHQFHIDDK
jgi:hypothetical protein